MTAHILLIEDEYEIARFVEMKLKSNGYYVSVVYGQTYELSLMKSLDPDLVILNPTTMMPMITSLDFFWRLQSAKNKIPVFLLAAINKIDKRITKLNVGVNDYLLKPFSVEELLNRNQTFGF